MPIAKSIFDPAEVALAKAVTTDQEPLVPAQDGLRMLGWAAAEAGGSAGTAIVHIIHGETVSGGSEIETIKFAGDESKHSWQWPGIKMDGGISLEVVEGEIDIEVYYLVLPDDR